MGTADDPPEIRLRHADPVADAAACAAIYAPYVSGSVATFECEPPSAVDFAERIEAAHAWLVAEAGGGPIGYAYGARHRGRAAYAWAADATVYVDGGWHGIGVGRALYGELLATLRSLGLWTACAGITEPNPASTGLHRSMGFQPVGTYRRIGWKAGAWRDVTWWQLDLRPGETGPPASLGR